MFIFLKNRHVYSINGWLVAIIVNTCNSYKLYVSSGEGWTPWFEAWPDSLDWSLLSKGPHSFCWMMTSWCYLPPSGFCFHVSFTLIRIWVSGTNTTWWTPAWCSTSHQMWRDKGALIVPILSQYYMFFLQKSKPHLSSSKNGTLVPVSCNSTSIPVSSSSQMYHLEI